MTFQMSEYRTNGAIGALLDEYQRAIVELKNLIRSVTQSELIDIVDKHTDDEDCRSIQTILRHVIRAGHIYIIDIRKHQGEDLSYVATPLENTIEGYCIGLDNMFTAAVDLFDEFPEIVLEEKEVDKKMKVKWGQRYDVEQLMEHAIVHVLRHRRQIERFLLQLRR